MLFVEADLVVLGKRLGCGLDSHILSAPRFVAMEQMASGNHCPESEVGLISSH